MKIKRPFQLFLTMLLGGCTSLPSNIEPVRSFEIDRYLGVWYEVARLDHSFERGLKRVSAKYSLLEDGTIQVINKGYSAEKEQWKKAVGKAQFAGNPETGHLKVSFWGPFYSSYVIFDLDRNSYQYAMVCGPNRKYLWILSRKRTLDAKITKELVSNAASMGFEVDELIYVSHNL